LKDRDARDSNRSAAPLVAASDAIEIDTTAMDPDEAFAAALASIQQHTG
jgi:cytidylate kinase